MSEHKKRDVAIKRARDNPDNHFAEILDVVRRWLIKQPAGTPVVSGQVRRIVLEQRPDPQPQEKRVMGAVIRTLSKEKLLTAAGISTRERSHKGLTREWKRARA